MATADYTQSDYFQRYESADMLGAILKHKITGIIGSVDCTGILKTTPARFELYLFTERRRFVIIHRKSELTKYYIRMNTH